MFDLRTETLQKRRTARHSKALLLRGRRNPQRISQQSQEADQKLSEARAAVVAQYLREAKDIPVRHIHVPVGYGATHPAVSNKDPYDRVGRISNAKS